MGHNRKKINRAQLMTAGVKGRRTCVEGRQTQRKTYENKTKQSIITGHSDRSSLRTKRCQRSTEFSLAALYSVTLTHFKTAVDD